MIANNAITSGQIAADLKLRDQTLVQAQTQIDQLAATMSSALSDTTTAGTYASPGRRPASASIVEHAAGQHHQPDRTPTRSTNTQHQITIVTSTDPTALPLQNRR